MKSCSFKIIDLNIWPHSTTSRLFKKSVVQINNCIGTGAFSEVFKVSRKSDGREYALKKVKLAKLSEKEKDNAINEVRILASVQHVNIAGYKEAFFE